MAETAVSPSSTLSPSAALQTPATVASTMEIPPSSSPETVVGIFAGDSSGINNRASYIQHHKQQPHHQLHRGNSVGPVQSQRGNGNSPALPSSPVTKSKYTGLWASARATLMNLARRNPSSYLTSSAAIDDNQQLLGPSLLSEEHPEGNNKVLGHYHLGTSGGKGGNKWERALTSALLGYGKGLVANALEVTDEEGAEPYATTPTPAATTTTSSNYKEISLYATADYDHESISSNRVSNLALGKDLFKLAAPTSLMIVVGFATQGMTVAFIGRRLGSEAIGHFSIGNSVFNLFGISIGFGLTAALDTLVSQSFGRHKQESPEIGEYIQRATLINLLLTIPVGFLFFYGQPVFELMFGAEIGAGAASYTKHTIPYMILYLIAETFIKVFQAIDEPNLPFCATLASAVACYFFNYYFTYGSFVSAAWVMTATYFVQVLALVGICFFHPRITFWKHCNWFHKNKKLFDRKGLKEYLAIGVPALMACIAEWWAFEVVQMIAAGISIRQVAVLNITMNVSGLLFSLSLGVCTAASVKVGNALGENKPLLAHRYGKVSIFFDQIMNCCTCTLLLCFRSWIGPIFTTEPDMVDEFCFLSLILAIYHWGDSTQIAIQGVFRGAGKQGQAVYPVLFSLWFVGLPMCYLFGRSWQMDAAGIMLGIIVGFCVEIPLLLRCMGKWQWRTLAAEASKS